MTEEMKKNDASRYIITDGLVIFGTSDTEGKARSAAETLASENDGTEYAVYQKIGSAKLEPKVTWKGAAR